MTVSSVCTPYWRREGPRRPRGGRRAAPGGGLSRLEDAAVGPDHRQQRLPLLLGGGLLLDAVDDLHALHDAPEDHVLPVKLLQLPERDEELARVGILPCVGHGHHPPRVVFQLEAAGVVLELLSESAAPPDRGSLAAGPAAAPRERGPRM